METYNNKLFEEGQMVVWYILPHYLDQRDLCRFEATCKFAHTAIQKYRESWVVQIKELAKKYHFEIDHDSHEGIGHVEPDYLRTVSKKVLYKVKNHPHTFRMMTHDGVATLAECRNGWSHTGNQSYYSWDQRGDTMFTNPIPHLKSV